MAENFAKSLRTKDLSVSKSPANATLYENIVDSISFIR